MGVVLAGVLHGTATAGPVLDQSDWVNSGNSYGSEFGQSFVAGLSGTLSSIVIGSSTATSSSGSDTVSIYRGDGFSGVLLASALLTPILNATGYTFDTTSLALSLVAGQQYTFDVAAGSGQTLYVNGDATNAYARGQLYYARTAYAYDLNFATYVTTAARAVPEPASLLVLGVGFAGLIATRRRRRP